MGASERRSGAVAAVATRAHRGHYVRCVSSRREAGLGVAEYGFDPSWSDEQRRLALLERCFDPPTMSRLTGIGVGPGWDCLEVGAGNGSIARWLRDQVSPNGRVVALDLDTRFFEDEPGVEARSGDILVDDLEEDAYDLVHCRALLHHLPGQQVNALRRMTTALRRSAVLVAEEPWLGAMFGSPTSAVVRAWRAWDEAMSADYLWAVALPQAFHDAGLVDIEVFGDAQVIRGGTPEAELLRLSVEAVRERVPPMSISTQGWRSSAGPTLTSRESSGTQRGANGQGRRSRSRRMTAATPALSDIGLAPERAYRSPSWSRRSGTGTRSSFCTR
jgi:SAM-dependent methyltransferase